MTKPATSNDHPSPENGDLIFETYRMLREGIKENNESLRQWTFYWLIGFAVYWSWILKDFEGTHSFLPKAILVPLLCLMPVALTFLVWLEARVLVAGIYKYSVHMARIEKAFGIDHRLGWESLRCTVRTLALRDLKLPLDTLYQSDEETLQRLMGEKSHPGQDDSHDRPKPTWTPSEAVVVRGGRRLFLTLWNFILIGSAFWSIITLTFYYLS